MALSFRAAPAPGTQDTADRREAPAKPAVTLFGKKKKNPQEFSFLLADKAGIVKKPEILVLLESCAVPQARIRRQDSPFK